MALMTVKDYADFIGLSSRRVQQLIREDRITGVITFNRVFRLVDTTKASIKPSFNLERRTTGNNPIGRSKPLRGEPGFKPK